MLARADAPPATTSLLAVGGGARTWAVPSAMVASIEPCDEAAVATAVDVLALLGAGPPTADLGRRVLVLDVLGQPLRLLARGALHLKHSSPRELLPLPAAFAACSPPVSHVALVDDKPVMLVLSPERVLSAIQATAHHPSLPQLPEASSC
jgi:hypothetical protein